MRFLWDFYFSGAFPVSNPYAAAPCNARLISITRSIAMNDLWFLFLAALGFASLFAYVRYAGRL